jgi:DNA-binding NarL/FixJ family response regulator
VLLCEDHQIYLAGLRTLLTSDPGLVLVGETDHTDAACAVVDRESSQVVVVVRQGLLQPPDYEPLHRLCERGAIVLVLAESESERDLESALRAGARGYLSRRLTAWQLLNGIRALARDEPVFDTAVARHLVRYLTDQHAGVPRDVSPLPPLEQLTERQRAVALLVAEGMTNCEIAGRLHVSQATVKSHLATVMHRLGIRSRTQLAILLNRTPEKSASA